MDIILDDSYLLMHSLVTLLSGILITHLYSLPYTRVLGFVAYQVTSKRFGIGLAERSRSEVKQLKHGKRSNLGGISLDKGAILFNSAKLRESHIRNQGKLERSNYFGVNDIWLEY